MEYSLSAFTINGAAKTFSTEASELPSFSLKSFKIVSDYQNTAEFACAVTERDADGDVTTWILEPTAESLSANPRLAGWKVIVFND
jgi:hypothetical protein